MLTQLCRDSEHPLFGSFDRNHWHYKIRDFSSMVLHQGILLLDLIAREQLNGCVAGFDPELAGEWRSGCLRFWQKQQNRNGSFDEYYPFEAGFPPTAFSLYATAIVSQNTLPTTALQDSMSRAARFLLLRQESQAINQQVVALTACSLAKHAGATVDDRKLTARWDQLFVEQSPEGWFQEYDGADTGYLSVACDALWDYYTVSADARALQAMKLAASYIHSILSVADDIPCMVNSRNTDYILSYGLAELGKHDEVASAVVHRSLGRIDQPSHFYHHIDERYSVHYVYTSLLRSLTAISNLAKPAPRVDGDLWMESAGIYVSHRRGISLHVAARKGGIAVRTSGDGKRDADYGWRGELGGKLTATHWQEPEAEVAFNKSGDQAELDIRTPLKTHGALVPTPWKHMVIRILAVCFGSKLIPHIKNVIIFRKTKSGTIFRRHIKIADGTLRICDSFAGRNPSNLRRASSYSLRHVSSAGSFCEDELSGRALRGDAENVSADIATTLP